MSAAIHITNAKGRDATLGVYPVKHSGFVQLGVVGEKLEFRRYLASTESGAHKKLSQSFGDDYGSKLIESDPEVDIEKVGKLIGQTQTVFINFAGELLYEDPIFLGVLLSPDGIEKERRAPVDTFSNVNIDLPVRWTGGGKRW